MFKMFRLNFFRRKRSDNPNLNINPDEFILLGTHLIQSENIKYKLIGIIMSTGIPLTHLNNKNILVAKNSNNTIIYKPNNGLELTRYTLIDSQIVVNAIQSLQNVTILPIQAFKLNRSLHKFFDLKITTKDLRNIYGTILNTRKNLIDNFVLFNNNLKNKISTCKCNLISLVNEPKIQNIEKKLQHIHSFNFVTLNKNNLERYKNSKSRFKNIIASIIEEFFSNKAISMYNHRPHKIKRYINLRLKEMNVPSKFTYKHQLEIFSNVFVK
ncbi:hypothetical protein [Borrelia persica]|uniref:hypothetical protein n=2 Tax=Borrelia persica TaxID=44448 RepID=UPI000462F04A|nr:hypothetical protein [Borrelia persica]